MNTRHMFMRCLCSQGFSKNVSLFVVAWLASKLWLWPLNVYAPWWNDNRLQCVQFFRGIEFAAKWRDGWLSQFKSVDLVLGTWRLANRLRGQSISLVAWAIARYSASLEDLESVTSFFVFHETGAVQGFIIYYWCVYTY